MTTTKGTVPFHIMTKPIGPICNLDCEYCYYLEKENLYPDTPSFKMSDETLENYIRSYIELNPGPEVAFAWQGGEPTLMGLNFFKKAVALQKKYLAPGRTASNALQTNGTLLDDDWCAFFKEHNFLIGISIDGPAHIHDVYRVDKGQKPTHAKVIRGLELLRKHDVEHNVLCVVNNVNSQHPLEVYRYFKDIGVTWLQFIPIVEHIGGTQVTHRSVAAQDWGRFLTTVFDEWIREDVGRIFVQTFEETIRSEAGIPGGLCVFQETCGNALALEHNGDLYSCDHFVLPEFQLGNIMETPMGRLVNMPEQTDFGNAKRDALPDYCRSCDVLDLCHGECPKNRFIETPDGDPGLNYLCAGYKQYFRHVRPYARRILDLLHKRQPATDIMALVKGEDAHLWRTTGRNEPCPCGSGQKYKRCCWNKQVS